MSSFVTVRTYGSELEAELGRVSLETNGIEAHVLRSDAGGLLRAVEPAQLVVHADDAERAMEVLDAPLAGEEELDDGSTEDRSGR